MDEEVEDIVGDVKYTDSQKSVTISNIYSVDFTDSSSDKNHSTSRETYIIDRSDSDNENTYNFNSEESISNLPGNVNSNSESEIKYKVDKVAHRRLKHCAITEDIFTQTSKTIFEVTNEVSIQKNLDLKSLETQTSLMYITEQASVTYAIRVGEHQNKPSDSINNIKSALENNESNSTLQNAVVNKNSEVDFIFTKKSQRDHEKDKGNKFNHAENSGGLTNCDSKIISTELYNDTLGRSTDDEETWSVNSDFEEDSLNDNEFQKFDSDVCNVSVLTPVTEETNKNESIFDVTPCPNSLAQYNYVIKSQQAEQNKLKEIIPRNKFEDDKKRLRLPPIYRNISDPESTLVDDMIFVRSPRFKRHKLGAVPNLIRHQRTMVNRWENGCKNLASGENAFIHKDDINEDSKRIQLPQVPNDGCTSKYKTDKINNSSAKKDYKDKNVDEISINEKIQYLKMNIMDIRSKTKSDSSSQKSSQAQSCTPCEMQLCDAAEKGCDALCFELLRQLGSCNWMLVAETLEYLPLALASFWPVIAEKRIADILRQLSALVESPRTHVARTACDAIAQMLKNTNYTKKPDFYEAIAILLTKTSTYNRVIRRAANLALDEIVCNVELVHTITAICVHGVEHKSPRVRCASSRLLIVCCALGKGGRQLLRSRPPTVATARKHVLRALALLLVDKNFETRKYAERLYTMLRPLPSFEAYFLTDVDVELATEQMKKYDFVLKKTNSG